ncbi:hypothetical protein CKO22_10195 [Thiococcus pfennigii]|nr:hypothetical protein [Thiococcus pfennigii]
MGESAWMKPYRQQVAWAAAVLVSCALAVVSAPALAAGCEDAMTSAEMLNCASRQYQTAQARLELAYQRLAARLPAPRRTQLEAAQEAWRTYRDAQATFVAGAAEEGTLYSILGTTERTALTEARIEALRQAPE